MDAKDFINASNFEIAEEITLKQINKDQAGKALDLNSATFDFISSQTLDAMFEASALSDESEGPSFPSYQPLNEAAQAVAGRNNTTSAVASTVNNALGIQGPALEFLGQTANFAEGTNFNITQETAAQIKEAQKTLASGVLSLANTAEKGDAGFKFSTSGAWDVGANAINMASDGTLHWNSPVITSVASVNSQQATAHQVTADVKTANLKNKFEHIEKTSTSVANDRTSVSVNSHNDVANNINQKAVIEHKVTTAKSKVNASELIDHNSQQDTRITAKGALHSQGSSVSITSSRGTKSPIGKKSIESSISGESKLNSDGTSDLVLKDASGKATLFKNVDSSSAALAKPKWKETGGLEGQEKGKNTPAINPMGEGSISITADSGMTMLAQDSVISSTSTQSFLSGSNLVMAAQGGLTQLATSMAVEAVGGISHSSKKGALVFTSGRTSTVMVGGQTFIGKRNSVKIKLPSLLSAKPIELRKVPNFPNAPKSITTAQLESCLPDKYKRDSPEKPRADKPEIINAPDKNSAARREKGQPIPTGKESGSISDSNLGVGNSSMPIADTAGKGITSSKMPTNSPLSSNQDPTNPNAEVGGDKIVGAAGVVKGGVDIFSKDKAEEIDVFQRLDNPIISPDLDNAESNPISTEEKEKRWLGLIDKINNSSFEALGVRVGASSVEVKIAIDKFETYKPILKRFAFSEIDSLSLSADLLPGVQRMYKDISLSLKEKLYQQGGVIDSVKSAYRFVNENINVVQSRIDDVANSGVVRITKDIKDRVKDIPQLEGLSKLLSSTDGVFNTLDNLNLNTSVQNLIDRSGDINGLYSSIKYIVDNQSDIVDTIGSNKLKELVTSSANSLNLFTDVNGSTDRRNYFIQTVVDELLSLKSKPDYVESGLSSQVINTLIETLAAKLPNYNKSDIAVIFDKAKDLLSSILSNKLGEIIPGATIENLLPYLIGGQNAALYGDLKGIYLKGKDIYTDALNTYESTISSSKELLNTGSSLYVSMKAIPAYVALMNQYKIPALNQVNTILHCFDLLNQFKSISNNVKSLLDTAKKFADPLKNTLSTLDDLFGLFKNASEDNSISPDLTGLVTDGLISGGLSVEVERVNNVPSTSSSNLKDIQQILVLQPSTTSSPDLDSCNNVIFSAAAQKGHSQDPANWQDKITNAEVVKLIETLPRLTQIFNSIKEIPLTPEQKFTEFGNEISPAQIADIKNTTINVKLDNCFVAPRLNLVESLVEIVEIKDSLMMFKMPNLDLLKFNNKNILPTNNNIVQIYVENFFNNKISQTLRVFRSEEFFSPLVHSYKIIEFKSDKNIGLAQYIPTHPRIYLQDINNVAFNYGCEDIGNKLTPIILDSYVLL